MMLNKNTNDSVSYSSRTTPAIQKEFTIIPAVDIVNGTIARGTQRALSDISTPNDAVDKWVRQGAEWIHLVDIDAAFGRGNNYQMISDIIEQWRHRVKFEVAGGISDEKSFDTAYRLKPDRIVIGTSAFHTMAWLTDVVSNYDKLVSVGLDIKGKHLWARGGVRNKDLPSLKHSIESLNKAGCRRFVVTDDNNDGAMTGVNSALLKEIAHMTPAVLTASGGVSALADISQIIQLSRQGYAIDSVIVGKALYTGAVNLQEAIRNSSRRAICE